MIAESGNKSIVGHSATNIKVEEVKEDGEMRTCTSVGNVRERLEGEARKAYRVYRRKQLSMLCSPLYGEKDKEVEREERAAGVDVDRKV